ncbi:MAG: TonB-dependent receptor domain-containing protein [Pyrinomonadaceae bacterium]
MTKFQIGLRNIARATFLLLLFSLPIVAQQKASIAGTVSDEQGRRVLGARVELIGRSGPTFVAITDETGSFTFPNIPPARYLLQVVSTGFAVYSSDQIEPKSGEAKSIKVELRLSSIDASVTVTATGTAQRAEEVSKTVSTVDSQEIEARHEISLPEALRDIPGVRLQQQGSFGALTSVRLRGQRNFDTALLLDGLRVRDASDINGSAVSLLADLVPADVEKVEVLRGSGSSIYGTNAIGGVINIIPVTGGGPFHLGLGGEGGSLAMFREFVEGSGGGERLGYSFGLSRFDVRKGIDGEDQYGNSGFSGRLVIAPSHSITIGSTFYGTIANARINDSPFALATAFNAAEQFPKAVSSVNFEPDFNNPDQGRRNRLLVGSGRFTHVLSDRISYTIAYQRVATKRSNYNGPAVDPRFISFVPFGDFEFMNLNRGTTDTIDARTTLRLADWNTATIGVEYERESLFQHSDPSFSAFNDTTDRQRTFAIFGQDQVSLFDGRLQMSAAVRGQAYRLRGADRPGDLQSTDTKSSVTADGAVAYFFRASGTKVRAHIGNGFRAPSLFERFGEGNFGSAGIIRFGDPTLRAEQSISADSGIDQDLVNGRVRMGLTYFYTHLQRLITFTGFTVDPLDLGRFSGFVNQAGGHARGVESSVETAPWRGANLHGAYTFTDSDRDVPGQGSRPEYVIPKHQFGVTFTQRLKRLLLTLDLNRTGSYLAPVFENNFPFRMAELRFAGYTKIDLYASYELQRSDRFTTTIFGGVDNLLGQKYFENGFLAPRRVGRGGLTLRF